MLVWYLPHVSERDRVQFKGLLTAIEKAAVAGRWEEVRDLTALAQTLVDRLTLAGQVDGDVPPDRGRQLKRRGAAVAKAKASNPLAEAVAADPRWGSMAAYAKSLSTSKQSLSAYVGGLRPCPAHVAARVKRDFPRLDWTWKKGIVR